jgi:hypothetical protein
MSAAFPSPIPSPAPSRGRLPGAVLLGVLSLLWRAIRIPALALFVILEPVVRVVLAGVALLLVLTALFYRAIGMPHFPFWTVLALGVGSALLLALYYALLRLLSSRGI